MFKNETEKFKHNNNLKYFAYCLLEHLKMHGLDTITYRPDPTDTGPNQQMLLVLANYPCFKKNNAAIVNLHYYNNLYDSYDQQNNAVGIKCFLNSLCESLRKDINAKTDDDT